MRLNRKVLRKLENDILLALTKHYYEFGYKKDKYVDTKTGGIYESKLAKNIMGYKLGQDDKPSPEFTAATANLEGQGYVRRMQRKEGSPTKGIWPIPKGLDRAEYLEQPWYGKIIYKAKERWPEILIGILLILITFFLSIVFGWFGLGDKKASDEDTARENKKPYDSASIKQHTKGDKSPAIVADGDVYLIYVDSLAGLEKIKPEINMLAQADEKELEIEIEHKQELSYGTSSNTFFSQDRISLSPSQKLDKFKNLLEQTKVEKRYSFDDWYYKGAAEFNNIDYPAAIISFNNALLKAPEDDAIISFAYNYKGAAHMRNGEPEKAFENYDAATTLLPDSPLPYSNIGRYYYHRKDYEEAFNNLNRASELFIIKGEYEWARSTIAETSSLLENKDINEKTKLTVKQEIEQLKMRLWESSDNSFYDIVF